jgi:hypothetical protein
VMVVVCLDEMKRQYAGGFKTILNTSATFINDFPTRDCDWFASFGDSAMCVAPNRLLHQRQDVHLETGRKPCDNCDVKGVFAQVFPDGHLCHQGLADRCQRSGRMPRTGERRIRAEFTSQVFRGRPVLQLAFSGGGGSLCYAAECGCLSWWWRVC